MLISFSIENWLSFRDQATFSMVAGREKQHLERVPHMEKYKMRLLPIAAVYGGNASGKTNLFKALSFARQLIVKGTQPEAMIPAAPFRLDPASASKPTLLTFELFAGDRCYEFGFRVTREQVVEEWLSEILKTTEKELYKGVKKRISVIVVELTKTSEFNSLWKNGPVEVLKCIWNENRNSSKRIY